jgi:hypothetical protein
MLPEVLTAREAAAICGSGANSSIARSPAAS